MSEQNYTDISNFRVPNYFPPSVRWDSLNTDDDIVALVKEFDTHIK